MNSYPPKLRTDLIVRPQQTAHGTSVIVKNPVTGKFFQLGEAELFIAEHLDGKTTLETIRQLVEARFGGELPLAVLTAFLQNLKKYGFLETADPTETIERKEPSRFRGSPLYCRFKVFDPCQLLKRLVSCTGLFYTPYFGVLSAATILAAVGVTFANWGDFRQELPKLYESWSTIAVVLALNFLVVGAHEFGHGLTCTRFGGEVHEMGCALVFLQPAFYCNVSDAWLFPEKSKRLWVGFAGPYFELFLWSLAVLTWRVSEPDTWINFIALSVMATSGLKTLLNFNPLIKLDGYYLLSDYLELPNMRRRSFRYVGSMVEKLFGFESLEENEVLRPRERVIFAIYGTVALAGSFSILGFILLSAGGKLVEGKSPTAVLVTLGLLGMRYRRRFRRMFGKASGASGSFDDEDFEEPEKTDNADVSAAPNEDEQMESRIEVTKAEQPAAQSVGELEVGKSAEIKHLIESAAPVNGNRFESSDQFRAEISGSCIQRILGSASLSHDSSGSRDTTETTHSVAVLEEPASPHTIDPSEELAHIARPAPQFTASENGSGVTASERADGTDPAASLREEAKASASRNGDHSDTSGATTNESGNLAEPKKKKSRRWGRRIRRTIWAAVAAGAVFGLVRGHAELRVAGPFNVLPIENSDVRASVDGLVDKIYVHEGDYVRAGQPIARLVDIDTRAALEKTEAQLAETGAKLRMQVAGPTANEIEIAKANVTKAEDNLKYAQIRLAMVKRGFEENLLSRKEYEDTAGLEAAARNDAAVAKDQLTLLVSGTRPEDIEATRAQIEQLQADQRHLGEQRRMLTVYSPSSGVVATPTLQLKQLTHQLVKKGDLIAKVFDLRTVTAQIAVDEKDIADVRVNQKVVLRARAYPDEIFYGTVNFVSTSVQGATPNTGAAGEASLLPAASSSSSSSAKKTILITTQINNHSLLLKPEMSGEAKILCGQWRALDLVKRRLAHAVKVEFWSWW